MGHGSALKTLLLNIQFYVLVKKTIDKSIPQLPTQPRGENFAS